MLRKPTILLVDGDQQVSGALPEVLRKLAETSDIMESRVYGAGLAPWKPYFDRMGFRISPLPPPVDYAMVADAIDLHHAHPEVTHFCIASADRDFRPLVAKLKERGMFVTGIAQGPVAKELRDECNDFLHLDTFTKMGLSLVAIPEIVATMNEVPWADGWADHNWLDSRLKQKGFNPRAFGKSSLIAILDALPAQFETRPVPRSSGPVSVRLKVASPS